MKKKVIKKRISKSCIQILTIVLKNEIKSKVILHIRFEISRNIDLAS